MIFYIIGSVFLKAYLLKNIF